MPTKGYPRQQTPELGATTLAAPNTNDMSSLGVALSGGGNRAAAFGLGALLYLVDSGVNRHVTTISSVSGGSLLNAFIALQDRPFNKCWGAEFELRAAGFAQCIAGNRLLWLLMKQVTLITLIVTSLLLWATAIETWTLLAASATTLLTSGLVLGRLSRGFLLWHWSTWLYSMTLIWALLLVQAIAKQGIAEWLATSTLSAWFNTHWVWWAALLMLSLLMWWLLAQQRHAIAGIAYGHALAKLPGTRGGPKAKLEDMNGGDIRHVLCATELHAGQHAYFSHDLVYSRGFGLGMPGGLRVRTAVQASANFPGGFPPRIIRAARFRFVLADQPEGTFQRSPRLVFRGYRRLRGADWSPRFEIRHPYRSRWMVLSDGGVFDNTADAWYLDEHDRYERLSKKLNEIRDEATSHRVLSDRLSVVRPVPKRLIIVNGGRPEPWQSLWSVWIPLIGELTGFSKITSTMYNNEVSKRLRDLRARFAQRAPEGAIVDIEEDPYSHVETKQWEERLLDRYRSKIDAHGVLPVTAEELGELKRKAQIRTEVLDYLGQFSFIERKLAVLNTAVATTLAPLGARLTARLIYHGYLQAMVTLHVQLGYPLLRSKNPAVPGLRPTRHEFLNLARGRPRSAKMKSPTGAARLWSSRWRDRAQAVLELRFLAQQQRRINREKQEAQNAEYDNRS
jgi:predicted acylesterase/phospholipase RssA